MTHRFVAGPGYAGELIPWDIPDSRCIACGARFEKGPTHWTCLGCGSRIRHNTVDDLSRLWDAVALWTAFWHIRRWALRDSDYAPGSFDEAVVEAPEYGEWWKGGSPDR